MMYAVFLSALPAATSPGRINGVEGLRLCLGQAGRSLDLRPHLSRHPTGFPAIKDPDGRLGPCSRSWSNFEVTILVSTRSQWGDYGEIMQMQLPRLI